MWLLYIFSSLIVVSIIYNLIEDAIGDEEEIEWNSADLDDEINRNNRELDNIDGKY